MPAPLSLPFGGVVAKSSIASYQLPVLSTEHEKSRVYGGRRQGDDRAPGRCQMGMWAANARRGPRVASAWAVRAPTYVARPREDAEAKAPPAAVAAMPGPCPGRAPDPLLVRRGPPRLVRFGRRSPGGARVSPRASACTTLTGSLVFGLGAGPRARD